MGKQRKYSHTESAKIQKVIISDIYSVKRHIEHKYNFLTVYTAGGKVADIPITRWLRKSNLQLPDK